MSYYEQLEMIMRNLSGSDGTGNISSMTGTILFGGSDSGTGISMQCADDGTGNPPGDSDGTGIGADGDGSGNIGYGDGTGVYGAGESSGGITCMPGSSDGSGVTQSGSSDGTGFTFGGSDGSGGLTK